MNIQHILEQTDHRIWPLPAGRWIWYQEWRDLVFFHMRVDISWLQKQLPAGLTIDTINGEAWISVVVFSMRNIRPRLLPSMNKISDFREINIRTYVIKDNKPGVYFLSIEGNRWLPCYVAKTVSGLPYRYASFSDEVTSLRSPFCSFSYNIKGEITAKSAFDIWVTERYCLYCNTTAGMYRYEIQHIPWPLYNLEVNDLRIDYPLLNTIGRSMEPAAIHYSPGVQVLAWPKVKL